ncbi:MAG: glycosyltransferase family 2 protein [Clostridiales bacterium]
MDKKIIFESTKNNFIEEKISFIVIGRNQKNTIYNCLNSIFRTCKFNLITNYEIIYVDSNSSDSTIQIIKENFPSVKIAKLTGKFNAAIGRNTGAKISTGNTLFFIDGDMEINRHFLKKVYSKSIGLKKNVISGKVQDYFYDNSWNGVIRISNDRFGIKKNSYQSFLGGIFIIKREVFFKFRGFTNYLKENEDKDFALKLSSNGEFIYYLNLHIAKHHTIDYNDFSRVINRFINGNMFFPSIIFRKYFTNINYLKSFFKLYKSFIILILSIVLGIKISFILFFIYPIFIIIKAFTKPNTSILEELLGTFLLNISFVIGLFFFYPKKIDDTNITYELL